MGEGKVSQPLTLTEFLLARVAEDEEWLASQSGSLEWCQECAFGAQPESPYSLSRMTIECKATRRIVELHSKPVVVDVRGHGPTVFCDQCDGGFPCATLRLLALPYADHPDYREEWRQ